MSRLREYFSVPSTAGFSPYRTGAAVHLVLNALLGGGVWMLSARVWALPPAVCGLAAVVAVISLWGVGCVLGVLSHYNPLITLGSLVGLLAALYLQRASILPGVVVGTLTHFLLVAMIKAANPKPAG